jgi:signal transduction histidine kinase
LSRHLTTGRILPKVYLSAALAVFFVVGLVVSLINFDKERQAYIKLFSLGTWNITQVELEYRKFLHSLDRFHLSGDASLKNELVLNFDLLWSRLPILLEGSESKNHLAMPGVELKMRQLWQTLKDVDTRVADLTVGDATTYNEIRREIIAHQLPLHAAVQYSLSVPDMYSLDNDIGKSRFMGFLAGIGMFLSAALLVSFLFNEFKRGGKLIRAREEAIVEAEIANRARADFLTNMSHELRTPLNAIIGFSEILKSEPFGPLGDGKYLEYVDDIHESGNHLLSLINDVLHFSKLGSGKTEFIEEEFSPNEAIQSALRMLQGTAIKRHITLQFSEFEEENLIVADVRAFKQIVINLVGNAIKFSSDHSVISIAFKRDNDDIPTLSVQDQGIGMEAEDIPKALAPFGQIASTHTKSHSGTGLGLPLVVMLAEFHGGELALESVPGEGTTALATFSAERLVPIDLAARGQSEVSQQPGAVAGLSTADQGNA